MNIPVELGPVDKTPLPAERQNVQRYCSDWVYSEQKKNTFVLNLLSFLQEVCGNGAQDSLHHGQMFFAVVGLNEKPV